MSTFLTQNLIFVLRNTVNAKRQAIYVARCKSALGRYHAIINIHLITISVTESFKTLNGVLMYTIEGVSSVAKFITAYEESLKPRLPFSNPKCVLCYQRQYFDVY